MTADRPSVQVELGRDEDVRGLVGALATRGFDARADGLVVHVRGDADELGTAIDDWLAEAPELLLVPERIDEHTWAVRPPLA